jgi:hypothetical protein
VVVNAHAEDLAAHEAMLDRMESAGSCLWRKQ